MKKIGVFGGSFNPIHIGHLFIAEAARQEFGLDKILFIPTGIPPHKNIDMLAPGFMRLEMVKHAISGIPYFEADPLEVNNSNVSYSVDTISTLKSAYYGSQLFLLIGEDTLYDLKSWKDPQKLLRMCDLIVYRRKSRKLDMAETEARLLKETFKTDTYFVSGPLMFFSSTDIRERIEQGLTIKYLVPDSVEQYIISNSLYCGSKKNG